MLIFNKMNDNARNKMSSMILGFLNEKHATVHQNATKSSPFNDLLTYGVAVDYQKIYKVKLTLKSSHDINEIFIFSEQRQLRKIINLKANVAIEITFNASLTEFIPFQKNKKIKIDYLILNFYSKYPLNEVTIEAIAYPIEASRLFLCGDSTVANQTATLPFSPELAYSSWGQSLSPFLKTNYAIDNLSVSGQTSENFINNGYKAILFNYLTKNDICLFQFGHNDQKLSHLLPRKQYYQNIISLIEEVQTIGANPVLVTPLARNTWNKNNQYLNLLEEYDEVLNEIGSKFDIPVIQLNQFSMNFWKSLGMKASTDYFPPNDYTHTNDYGAFLFADYISNQLAKYFPDKFIYQPNPELRPPKDIWQHSLESTPNVQRNQNINNQNIILHNKELKLNELIDAINAAQKDSSK